MNQLGFGDIDKYGGLLVTLANWTTGGNNNFGVRGSAPARKSELERHAQRDLAERQSQHQDRLLVHRSQAHPVEYLPDGIPSTTNRLATWPQRQTATGLSLASALLGFPNDFQAQLPILHGGPVNSSTPRGQPSSRTNGS